MDNRMNIQQQIKCLKSEIVGFKYRHFKGGVYLVTDIAVHSELEEPMVIYKSVDNPDLVWCRPLSMFMSEVDHEKYPDVKQLMRFERIEVNTMDELYKQLEFKRPEFFENPYGIRIYIGTKDEDDWCVEIPKELVQIRLNNYKCSKNYIIYLVREEEALRIAEEYTKLAIRIGYDHVRR